MNKKKIKKGDYKYKISALISRMTTNEYLNDGGNTKYIEKRILEDISYKLGYSIDWCKKRFQLRKSDRGALNSDQLIIVAKYLNCSVDELLIYERKKEKL